MIAVGAPTQKIQLPQMQLFNQELSATQHAENSLLIIAHQASRGADANLKAIREASEAFHQYIKDAEVTARHQLYMRWFDLKDAEKELVRTAESAKAKS